MHPLCDTRTPRPGSMTADKCHKITDIELLDWMSFPLPVGRHQQTLMACISHQGSPTSTFPVPWKLPEQHTLQAWYLPLTHVSSCQANWWRQELWEDGHTDVAGESGHGYHAFIGVPSKGRTSYCPKPWVNQVYQYGKTLLGIIVSIWVKVMVTLGLVLDWGFLGGPAWVR